MKSSANVGSAKSRPTAVILAADVNGLGAVRSLWLRKVPTVAVVRRAGDAVLSSRLPQRSLVVEDDGVPGEALLEHLMRLECGAEPILIATTDLFMEFLVAFQNELRKKYRFVVPDDETVATLIDKRLETERLAKAGIPLPRTVNALASRSHDWHHGLRFPVIVKPRASKWGGRLGAKNRLLEHEEQARAFTDEYFDVLDFLLAQEVVPGTDANQWVCNAVFDRDSRLISCFTFQRLRLSPAHFGVTSFAISRWNADVASLVRRIGEELAYVGPAMIEFKKDERDGQYKYIETNPRLGMCNWFDTCCGIENVYHVYQLAQEIEVRAADVTQREGSVFVSLFSDLYARRKDCEKPFHVLRHYMQHGAAPWVFAYWVWWDPMPCCVVWKSKLAEVCQALWRKLTHH